MKTITTYKTPSGVPVLSIPKTASSSLRLGLFDALYPNYFKGSADATPYLIFRMRTRKLTNPHPIDEVTPHVLVREPIAKFISGMQKSLGFTSEEEIDQVISELENILVGGEKQEDQELLKVDHSYHHVKPSSMFLGLNNLLYKMDEHLDEFMNAIGLAELPAENATQGDPITLTTEQTTRLEVLFADDIALYNSITESAMAYFNQPLQDEMDAEIEAQKPKPPVPQVVAAWRIKAIAELQGLTASIDAAIDAITDPQVKIVAGLSWREGNEIARNSSLIISMAQGLGLTEEQLDEMFIAAATLEV